MRRPPEEQVEALRGPPAERPPDSGAPQRALTPVYRASNRLLRPWCYQFVCLFPQLVGGVFMCLGRWTLTGQITHPN